MYKVGFIGLPSSGKTTAAKYLASNLLDVKTILVPEFARDYMVAKGSPISTAGEQVRASEIQGELEERACISNPRVLITDTPLLTTEAYTRLYYPDTDLSANIHLSRVYKYDTLFFCTGDRWNEDGVRFQTDSDLNKLEVILKDLIKTYHSGELIYLPVDKQERREELLKFSRRFSGLRNHPEFGIR